VKKILVVLSSVRESRIADNIYATVKKQLDLHEDFEITVADFKQMPLPFFDAPLTPSNEHFVATDPNVIKWAKMVEDADAVIMLVAEYNYSMTAVLKNAIDWVFKPWAEKPVAMIGYGWVGGARAITAVRVVLGSLIGAKAMETEANLRFMKEIDLEGNVTDEEAVNTSINATLEELKLTLG
jgi:NAD(P)H-dependent FMN reductase